MKKYISFFSLVLCISGVQAQDISDALRYAQDHPNGTARFRAMSGAFGALGGDMSAISVNPAGSAVFANNQLTVTVSNFNTKNNSDYFGTKASESNNSFDLNQAGGVFVFENHSGNSDWKKFSLAVNYENLSNFDNDLFSAGRNPSHSGTNFFVNYANGIKLGVIEGYNYDELNYGEQQASLAYYSYLINPDDSSNPNNTLYFPNITATGNYYQENEVSSTGYNGKLSFNAATQYKDLLFLGINLNSHFTDYRRSSSFYEDYAGATGENTAAGVQRFRYNNDLYTYGSGFSFQLGAIVKPIKELRIGLAYESPTWMTLNDELSQSLTTACADCPEPVYNEDPGVTNVYEPYKISTPGKWTFSLASVFGTIGLISVDVSTKDYAATKFKPQSDFSVLNRTMANTLTRAYDFRVGAEHKIKQWSLRAGYHNEGSPYENKDYMGNLTGYSGGVGYNFGSTRLDLAYSASKRKYGELFFSQGMTDRATIEAKNNNVTLTLAFEL
ncbi:outer membrane protein transport protein [Flavobacterium humi]|uniref:Transporter n=1 Tax=Flavobacterium humi TaxID=2562683 RepID=A0A4Z0L6E4_9FLAO|nr:outer membrane protein transport protein [Flavobacterium humi]TGD58076.1 transporter [Flavobacterium humi]